MLRRLVGGSRRRVADAQASLSSGAVLEVDGPGPSGLASEQELLKRIGEEDEGRRWMGQMKRERDMRVAVDPLGQALGSGDSSLEKRKHQITWLAIRAREREYELKQQWAQSSMSRAQTQAKYGFR